MMTHYIAIRRLGVAGNDVVAIIIQDNGPSVFNSSAPVTFIPDNIPIIGNLDEAGAVFIIISALNYFGFKLPNIFKKEDKKQADSSKPTIIINK